MERKPLRLLVLEDSSDDVELLLRELRVAGYDVAHRCVSTADDTRSALRDQEWDLIISDHNMPSFSSFDALALLRESGLDIPFIIISGSIGEDEAVRAMLEGAGDFLIKGRHPRLIPAIERELRESRSRRARKKEQEALKNLEEQLLQAQKMEAIGQLAGGIAHDFNNFLSVIIGYSELVSGSIAKLPSLEEVGADVREIRLAADKAATLTRQLLAFSRRQILQPTVMSLNESVSGMEKMVRHLIGANIQLEVFLSPDAGCIRADTGQIEQVVMNLVLNARDAMPTGGRLTLETRRVSIDADDPRPIPAGEYSVLIAADTGIGMDALTRSRIYEPFFTTKDKGKGTGLGMSTVYGIVRQTGGHILLESEMGRGSAFTIYVPLVEEAPAEETVANPIPSAAPGGTGSEVILLVEDDGAIRTMLARYLRISQYEVLEAANADEAIGLAGTALDRISLMITDIVMPGMNGFDLGERLRKDRSDLKILYVSGYADHAVLRNNAENGEMNFLLKPFSPETLGVKIRQILAR